MYDVYIDTLPCYMVLVSLHHVLFATIVHTSLSWLVNLAYMIGTKAQFAIRTCFWYRFHDFPLLPYDMCCNGTGQWACILQCFWYRDVPSICYHLFVLEIRLLNSMLKFRYEVLHYYLSFDYLCIIFGRLVRLFLLWSWQCIMCCDLWSDSLTCCILEHSSRMYRVFPCQWLPCTSTAAMLSHSCGPIHVVAFSLLRYPCTCDVFKHYYRSTMYFPCSSLQLVTWTGIYCTSGTSTGLYLRYYETLS